MVALAQEFGLPVHVVGVGEKAEDLRPSRRATSRAGCWGSTEDRRGAARRPSPCQPAAGRDTHAQNRQDPADDETDRPTPIPDLDSLPEDIRTRILGVQERFGFIPTSS